MALRKRRKSSRFRGSHTHGRGGKKKARGSGHRGGVGMSGTGKRADHRKSLVLNLYGSDYFGSDKTLRRGHIAPPAPVINLGELSVNLKSMLARGSAVEKKGVIEVDLSEYKLLGDGELPKGKKLAITAKSASASAVEAVEKSGSTIKLLDKQDDSDEEQVAP